MSSCLQVTEIKITILFAKLIFLQTKRMTNYRTRWEWVVPGKVNDAWNFLKIKSHNFWGKDILWSTNFFQVKIFQVKFFWVQNFWEKTFEGQKIFWGETFLLKFLAVMSNSRIDDVTQVVCSYVPFLMMISFESLTAILPL